MKFSKKATLFALMMLTSAQNVWASDSKEPGSAFSTPERPGGPSRMQRPLLVPSLPRFEPDPAYRGKGELFRLSVRSVLNVGRTLVDTVVAHGDTATFAPTVKLVRKVVDALAAPLIEPNFDIAWDSDENKPRSDADATRLGKARGLSETEIERVVHNVGQIKSKQTAPGIPGITPDRKTRTFQGIYAPADFAFYLDLIEAFYAGAGVEDLNTLTLDVVVPSGTYDPKRRERKISSPRTRAHTHFHIATSTSGELDMEAGNMAVLGEIHASLLTRGLEGTPQAAAFIAFRNLIGAENLQAFPYGTISKPISLEAAMRNAPKIEAFVKKATAVISKGNALTSHIPKILPPPIKRHGLNTAKLASRRGSGTYGSTDGGSATIKSSRAESEVSEADIREATARELFDGSALPFPEITPTLRAQINNLRPLVLKALNEHTVDVTKDSYPVAHHALENTEPTTGKYRGTRQDLIALLGKRTETFPGLTEEGDLAVLESLVNTLEALQSRLRK